jgi:hypothetical protein
MDPKMSQPGVQVLPTKEHEVPSIIPQPKVMNPLAASMADNKDMKSLASQFQQSIGFLVSISIFGASVFTIILGQMQDPKDISPNPTFSLQTVRIFLTIAWICFILCIGVAGYTGAFLNIIMASEKENVSSFLVRHRRVLDVALWTLFYGFIITAFFFLSLALVPYADVAGWVAVGCTALFGVVSVVFLVLQLTRKWTPVTKEDISGTLTSV